jgi:hypothetical protein
MQIRFDTLLYPVNGNQKRTGQRRVPPGTGICYPIYNEVNPPNPEDPVLQCK